MDDKNKTASGQKKQSFFSITKTAHPWKRYAVFISYNILNSPLFCREKYSVATAFAAFLDLLHNGCLLFRLFRFLGSLLFLMPVDQDEQCQKPAYDTDKSHDFYSFHITVLPFFDFFLSPLPQNAVL